MTKNLLSAVAISMLVGQFAHAALQDTKNRKEGEKKLVECSKETKNLFGFKVEMDVKDLEKSKEYKSGLTHASIADRCCETVLNTLKQVGSDEDGKTAIKAKVGTVVCHWDSAMDKKERSEGEAKFSGKKLTVSYSQNTSFDYNNENWLKKWLMSNL